MTRKRLIILGSTGSIGTQTLDVVRDFPDRFEVVALAAGGRVDELARQAAEFRPKALCVGNLEQAGEARAAAHALGARLHGGEAGLIELVEQYDADLVLVATVGFVGVLPTLRAVERGMTVALANKEVLVTAGDIIMPAARKHGVAMLPVDSEHNAIFQCLNGCGTASVRRLILTASGGPFRGASRERLGAITPAEALRHPTWQMGPKITIDSATLMNKGFEVIEARHLFDIPIEQVDVVVHPESTIHSMVEYVDGSVIAQLGVTNMYLPIQNVLMYPDRTANKFPPLDLARLARLTFEEPDRKTFPCLSYAYDAAAQGKTYPTVLNAANEVAVARFLAGEIGFLEIPETIDRAMQAHTPQPGLNVEEILEADRWARAQAAETVGA